MRLPPQQPRNAVRLKGKMLSVLHDTDQPKTELVVPTGKPRLLWLITNEHDDQALPALPKHPPSGVGRQSQRACGTPGGARIALVDDPPAEGGDERRGGGAAESS